MITLSSAKIKLSFRHIPPLRIIHCLTDHERLLIATFGGLEAKMVFPPSQPTSRGRNLQSPGETVPLVAHNLLRITHEPQLQMTARYHLPAGEQIYQERCSIYCNI